MERQVWRVLEEKRREGKADTRRSNINHHTGALYYKYGTYIFTIVTQFIKKKKKVEKILLRKRCSHPPDNDGGDEYTKRIPYLTVV